MPPGDTNNRFSSPAILGGDQSLQSLPGTSQFTSESTTPSMISGITLISAPNIVIGSTAPPLIIGSTAPSFISGSTPLYAVGATFTPPPPQSSITAVVHSFSDADSGKKKGVLPPASTNVMKTWLFKHILHPYPSEDEKLEIVSVTGLSLHQVNNWFINARRRILQPMLDNPSNPTSPTKPTSPTQSKMDNPMSPTQSILDNSTLLIQAILDNPTSPIQSDLDKSIQPNLIFSKKGDLNSKWLEKIQHFTSEHVKEMVPDLTCEDTDMGAPLPSDQTDANPL